jgi:poly(A) polymerase
MTRLEPQPWMTAPATEKLMAALPKARFVGGAVRNTLLGKPVTEVDVAAPYEPPQVSALLAAAGIKTVPTGIEHGTVTAVVDGTPFEVTSLRRDVATDGRRAVVAFTTDWAEDAQRRDFTMNALYAAPDGELYDFVDGLADLHAGKVRFVGDPVTRIREDYLRILRLFRFQAWYGAGEIDAAALAAAQQEKTGLAKLSGERIAKEMLKLLEAQDPLPCLIAMRDTSILSQVLPGVANLMRLGSLAKIGRSEGFAPDGLLRLATLLTAEGAATVAARWKLSTAQRIRLEDICSAKEKLVPTLSPSERDRLLYRLGVPRFKDRLFLVWAGHPRCAAHWQDFLATAETWQKPHFPFSGGDVMEAGVPRGPLVGQVLAELEAWWIENGFSQDRAALDQRLKQAVQARLR